MSRNGVAFRKDHISKDRYSLKAPYPMVPKGITVHNTYNDASAANEIANIKRPDNNASVSFHRASDNKEIVEGVPINRNAWHAGDGGNGFGNRNTIGYEICYSKSGGIRYDKAETNAIMDIAYEMYIQGWSIKKVWKHQDWSGKNCPHRILAKSRGWEGIVQAISDELDRLKGKSPSKPATKPKPPSTSKPSKKGKPDYSTGSIVTFLNSIKTDSSYNNREKLAGYYGISGYKGTGGQNTKLLNLLKKDYRASGKTRTSKPSSSGSSSGSGSFKGKRVESKVNGLRFYNKPSWEDKYVVGKVNKGIGFPTIVSKHKVGGGYQYKVKNSKGATYYITAADKYVKVVGAKKQTTSKPKTPSFKAGGKVKIKSSAKTYSRTNGVAIPSRFKNKSYTIQQVGSNDVLIKELYSWVRKSDLA